MIRCVYFVISAAFVMITASCDPESKVKTENVLQNLPEAPEPVYHVGAKFSMKRGDEIIESEIVEIDGNLIAVKVGDECVYRRRSDGYGPAISWDNCNGSSGSIAVEEFESIFPLKVGRKSSYKYSVVNDDGERFEHDRVCSVTGTARVSVPAGEYDTYEIHCDDGSWLRKYFYSPEIKLDVISERLRKSGDLGGGYYRNELINYSKGDES